MTEYEVIDAISSLRAETGQHVMNFVSVMFGYIVAAYLVGAKMSRFQVTLITIIYLIWAPGPIMAAYDGAVAFQGLYYANLDGLSIEMGASPLIENAPTVVSAGLGLSLLMSVMFMFQVRTSRKGKNGALPNQSMNSDA